jgi:hypothetical protein
MICTTATQKSGWELHDFWLYKGSWGVDEAREPTPRPSPTNGDTNIYLGARYFVRKYGERV